MASLTDRAVDQIICAPAGDSWAPLFELL